mgnify:FL=1
MICIVSYFNVNLSGKAKSPDTNLTLKHMRKQLLSLLAFVTGVSTMGAASFLIDEKEYEYQHLIKKEIGPGVVYNRIRIPDYPLNVNYLTVDLTNPYNRIETQQGQEKIGSLERLADAYTRMKEAGRKPLGAQNANFWVVSGHGLPNNRYAMGTTFNANVKNGQIITETNNYSDQFVGGPTRSGVIGIDKDKKLWIESMEYRGWLSSAKWGDWRAEIIQCNRFGRRNEMVMFNTYYPNNKPFQIIEWGDDIKDYRLVEGENTEVYLDLEEGQQWAIGKDFTAVVKEIKTKTSGGVLGDYDLCLTANGDNYLPHINQLAVGDKVTLNFGWRSYDTNEIPEIENMVGGNAIILKNGELTERNVDEEYNSQVYSRSAYGVSQDGKTLFMLVIDKSTDPVYGLSSGCSTGVEAQIMKQLGAWNVCAVDAGGSAQLMSQGDVVNTTTEGTPRAVANGWMVYSVAPDTEQSQTIARIEFLDPEIVLPIYSTYKPVVLGYNVYGELINEDVQGFTLSSDSNLGEANGDVFNTLNNVGEGNLTVHYGDITATRKMTVVDAELKMRIPKIINDGREYPIEVISIVGFDQFSCDPSRLEWTVADPAVLTVTDGVLKGQKNGTTTITGKLGDFTVSSEVSVELAEGESMPVYRNFPEKWSLKQTGGTDLAVSEYEQGLKFSYTGNGGARGAYFSAAADYQVWSMPKSLRITVNPGGATVKKISITAKNGLGELSGPVVFTDEQLPADKETTVELPISEIWDVNDVAIYPIVFQTLRFDMGKSEKGKQFDILIPKYEAVYGGGSGVDAVELTEAKVSVWPNPVSDGKLQVSLEVEAETVAYSIYGTSGLALDAGTLAGQGGTIDVSLLPSGIYFLQVLSGQQSDVCKFIVK